MMIYGDGMHSAGIVGSLKWTVSETICQNSVAAGHARACHLGSNKKNV